MPIYEVTAAGFDASDDATDDRVFWVEARDASIVMKSIETTGAKFCGEVDLGYYPVAFIDFKLPQQDSSFQRYLLRFASEELPCPSMK